MSPEPAHRRADRRLALGPLELVGPAHGLDDGGERGPAVVGRGGRAGLHGAAEPRDRQVDDRGRGPPPRRRRPAPSRSAAPARKFSATTSKRGARRSTRSRPAGFLRSMTTERLDRLLRMKVAPTARPSGSVMAGMALRPRSPRAGCLDLDDVGAEPARAAGWRRGAPASARGRGHGRRRAACPSGAASGLTTSPSLT